MNPLDPKTTALIVIDLQQFVVRMPVAPRTSAEVVANAKRLVEAFRAAESTVILVHVAFSKDFGDRLMPVADSAPPMTTPPPDYAEFVPEIAPREGDLVITKRQWGAFYGTDLDLQLRRRDIRTLVLCGISTNFGVESTARAAFEHGYDQILVEDAMAGPSAEAHHLAVSVVFPRMGLVRSTTEVVRAIGAVE
jgi:nicotinamidase-related amidase